MGRSPGGIVPVIENVSCLSNKKINLIADTGYVMNEKNEIRKQLENKQITLVTSYRKNQKKQNTDDEKKKLKKRCRIEHLFARIKKFNRVHVRKDRYMINYMGLPGRF